MTVGVWEWYSGEVFLMIACIYSYFVYIANVYPIKISIK